MVLPRQQEPSASVFLDGESIGLNPNEVSLCPSGIQFVSNTPVPQYKVVELTFSMSTTTQVICKNSNDSATLQAPADHPKHGSKNAPRCQTVNCSGMVVDCCKNPDCGSYKISLYFLDIPDTIREKICSLPM